MDAKVMSAPSAGAGGRLREIDELPGPRGIPLLGNLLQAERARIHQVVENWARQYGSYFTFRLAGRRFLVVADHEAVAAVLRDRPEGFGRTAKLHRISAEAGFERGVFSVNGETWRRQRRMVMASFDPAHVKAYFPSLVKVSQRLGARWQKAARAAEPIDLQSDLMRFTVDAIAGLAFGSEVNTLESDDDIIQHHLDKIFPMLFKRILAPVSYWHYLKLPADRQFDRSVLVVKAAIDGFVAQARQRLAADPGLRQSPRNLLEAMLCAADQPASGLTDRDVSGNVLTMLLAGEDTTANTLAWMIHLLDRNQPALARARDEVRRVVGTATALTLEQMAQLPFIEACIHETMRLKPVGPFLPLEAHRDSVIGDIRVPAGTLVWCVMRHETMDDRYFANAGDFQPQRWLDAADPAQQAHSAKRLSMPFGAGPRICPGRYLALLEMKLAMATLLSQFDIAGVDTPDGAEARERMAFTMTPVGLRMRLRPAVLN